MSPLWFPSSGLSSSGEVFDGGMLDEKADGKRQGWMVGKKFLVDQFHGAVDAQRMLDRIIVGICSTKECKGIGSRWRSRGVPTHGVIPLRYTST